MKRDRFRLAYVPVVWGVVVLRLRIVRKKTGNKTQNSQSKVYTGVVIRHLWYSKKTTILEDPHSYRIYIYNMMWQQWRDNNDFYIWAVFEMMCKLPKIIPKRFPVLPLDSFGILGAFWGMMLGGCNHVHPGDQWPMAAIHAAKNVVEYHWYLCWSIEMYWWNAIVESYLTLLNYLFDISLVRWALWGNLRENKCLGLFLGHSLEFLVCIYI